MSLNLFSLAGKNILVTGGGRGLGRTMAQGMAEANGNVAIVSRTKKNIEEAAQSIGHGTVGIVADIGEGSAESLVNRVEEALGGEIDVVLHAAGVQHRQPAESFDPAEWDRILGVNLTAPFRLSQEIGSRQLNAGRSGSHIFIGSITSLLMVPEIAAYTAAKSGIYGITRSLSGEWSDSGVRSNAIGPGYFRTEMTEQLFSDPEKLSKMMDRIPMGRFGHPKELIGATIFLASEASSYVTGQLLMVDGGWTSH